MRAKRVVLKILVLLFMPLSSFAQEIGFPDLNGFKKITKYPVYTPSNLWDFINGAADGYLAMGFVDLHVAEYKKGKEIIKLEIYKHSDHTMAFGIYASERSPTFRYLNLGSQGYAVDGMINFFKGDYYVKSGHIPASQKCCKPQKTLPSEWRECLRGHPKCPHRLHCFRPKGKK